MPVPLEDHVRQVLLEQDRGTKLYLAIHNGWRTACARYPERDRWRRKATFRGLVWEEIVQGLALVSDKDGAITLKEHQDTASLIVEDEILLRVKHANVALTTANYPTPNALQFDDHSAYGLVLLPIIDVLICGISNSTLLVQFLLLNVFIPRCQKPMLPV